MLVDCKDSNVWLYADFMAVCLGCFAWFLLVILGTGVDVVHPNKSKRKSFHNPAPLTSSHQETKYLLMRSMSGVKEGKWCFHRGQWLGPMHKCLQKKNKGSILSKRWTTSYGWGDHPVWRGRSMVQRWSVGIPTFKARWIFGWSCCYELMMYH